MKRDLTEKVFEDYFMPIFVWLVMIGSICWASCGIYWVVKLIINEF